MWAAREISELKELWLNARKWILHQCDPKSPKMQENPLKNWKFKVKQPQSN